jgi:hypothetical protein
LSVGLGNVSNIPNIFEQVPKSTIQNLQQTILIKYVFGLQCGFSQICHELGLVIWVILSFCDEQDVLLE